MQHPRENQQRASPCSRPFGVGATPQASVKKPETPKHRLVATVRITCEGMPHVLLAEMGAGLPALPGLPDKLEHVISEASGQLREPESCKTWGRSKYCHARVNKKKQEARSHRLQELPSFLKGWILEED